MMIQILMIIMVCHDCEVLRIISCMYLHIASVLLEMQSHAPLQMMPSDSLTSTLKVVRVGTVYN